MRHPEPPHPDRRSYTPVIHRRSTRALWATFVRPGVALVLAFFWTLFRCLGRTPWSALFGAVLATVVLVLLAGDAE